MNGVLTTSTFLLFLFAAISPVFPNPRPRKLHTRMLNSPIRESEMFETSNNYVDGYDQEAKESFSTSCVYYDYKEECHNSNDGCEQRFVQCPTSRYGQRRACYALWKDGKKVLQGCWAAAQTCKRECKGVPLGRNLNFCCCVGDNCNEDYGLQNDISEIRR